MIKLKVIISIITLLTIAGVVPPAYSDHDGTERVRQKVSEFEMEFRRYYVSIHKTVKKNMSAVSKNKKEIAVNLKIDKTGHIVEQQLLISCGDARRDEAAMAAIEDANPLPRPPANSVDPFNYIFYFNQTEEEILNAPPSWSVHGFIDIPGWLHSVIGD